MQVIPYIPETAPFSAEQRQWLNGFLAGLLSGAPAAAAQAAPAMASLKIAVLHASQSGTGESLARKMAKELKAKGHTATVTSLDGYSTAALSQEEHAVLIASTYGEGDPPDAAKPFYRELTRDDAPRLTRLSYTVFALGDSSYEHFCKFGSDLDERLESLGARRLTPRVESDVEVDGPFAQWKAGLFARLEALALGTAPVETAVVAHAATESAASLYSRDNPWAAPLLERRLLTCATSSKQTVHLAFSLAGSGVKYEAGDALGVVAQNDPVLVEQIFEAVGGSGCETVKLAKLPETSLREALTRHVQINKLTRRIIEFFAGATESVVLKGLLVPEQQGHLEDFCYGRDVLDLLLEFPAAIKDVHAFIAVLPKLAPRLYSISSSPAAHVGEVHTTVAVVQYRSYNRERGGVCSTMLGGRCDTGTPVPVYVQPNKRFRLPALTDAPIIMIGPGTGIAPFRSFLHERRAVGASGRNWLFFGERSAATEFLYRDELLGMKDDGHLTRLDLAFSRDQERKVYVQDRMLEQGAELWRWLAGGASVYVCGDASRMAKDVDRTLHSVVEQHGGLEKEAAATFVQTLQDEHRYHRDVY